VRFLGRAIVVSGLIVSGLAACNEDKKQADYTIDIQTLQFFPNQLSVRVGSTVRWVNINPRDSVRTVTSGTGPEDSTAGALFDATLRGYLPGDPEGEDFVYQFQDRGTVFYFSRYPTRMPFSGRVEVQ
jgi:plastocyanin